MDIQFLTLDELMCIYNQNVSRMYQNLKKRTLRVETKYYMILIDDTQTEITKLVDIRKCKYVGDIYSKKYFMYIHYDTAKTYFPDIFVPKHIKFTLKIKELERYTHEDVEWMNLADEKIIGYDSKNHKAEEIRENIITLQLYPRHVYRNLPYDFLREIPEKLFHTNGFSTKNWVNSKKEIEFTKTISSYIIQKLSGNENSIFMEKNGDRLEKCNRMFAFVEKNTLNRYECGLPMIKDGESFYIE